MAIDFIETDAKTISQTILESLENGINEPLYPGDERRIFGEALAAVVTTLYNNVNDACNQKLLRYARGDVLDALGENRDVKRLGAEYATTTLRFKVKEVFNQNIIIPEGIRVSSDFERFFVTTKSGVISAGNLYVDVPAQADSPGVDYNGIQVGIIKNIVDTSDIPYVDSVENIVETSGGSSDEVDNAYRERIREAENKLSTAGPASAYKYWALTSNSKVIDAIVSPALSKFSKTLQVYNNHAFIGGEVLVPSTLNIKNATPADYDFTYVDGLLEIVLKNNLIDSSTIDVEIDKYVPGGVKIIPICADGEIPDEEVLADVLRVCSSDDVKPLTDKVFVEAPQVELYDIELKYYVTASDESQVVEAVEGEGGAIDQYIKWQSENTSQGINPDYLKKLVLMANSTRVDVAKPTFKTLSAATIAKHSGILTISHEVI